MAETEPLGRNNYQDMSEVEQEIVYYFLYAFDKHDLVMLAINCYMDQKDLDEIVYDYISQMKEKEEDGLYPAEVLAYGP